MKVPRSVSVVSCSSVFHDRANSRYKGSKNCAIEHRKGHQMFYRTSCIIFKGLLCIVHKPRNEISSKEWSLEQLYLIKYFARVSSREPRGWPWRKWTSKKFEIAQQTVFKWIAIARLFLVCSLWYYTQNWSDFTRHKIYPASMRYDAVKSVTTPIDTHVVFTFVSKCFFTFQFLFTLLTKDCFLT